jgi:diadenosine tetraphosphate (Ap4A) HIT family hydrolase
MPDASQTPIPSPGAISARVDLLRLGDDPHLIARLPGGWAVLGDRQPADLVGCCMLLPDPVVPSVNDLSADARGRFLTSFVRLGDAVLAATGAERINYLILCNQVPELHGHVIPRFASESSDRRRLGPFEAYDFSLARHADAAGVDADLLGRLRRAFGS